MPHNTHTDTHIDGQNRRSEQCAYWRHFRFYLVLRLRVESVFRPPASHFHEHFGRSHNTNNTGNPLAYPHSQTALLSVTQSVHLSLPPRGVDRISFRVLRLGTFSSSTWLALSNICRDYDRNCGKHTHTHRYTLTHTCTHISIGGQRISLSNSIGRRNQIDLWTICQCQKYL